MGSVEVLTNRPKSGLRAVYDTHLAKNVLDVLFYRLVANLQIGRDLVVRQSSNQLLDDFRFTRCQLNITASVSQRGGEPGTPEVFPRPDRLTSRTSRGRDERCSSSARAPLRPAFRRQARVMPCEPRVISA